MQGVLQAYMKSIAASLLALGLVGCVSQGPAPIIDRSPARANPPASVSAKPEPARPVTPQIAPSTNGLHTVQRGDTLYAIAFANSLDYREIAGWNQLESADRIFVGQVLRLTPPQPVKMPGGVEIRALESLPLPSASPLVDVPVLSTPQAVLLPYTEANWTQIAGAPAVAVASPPPVAIRPAVAAPAVVVPSIPAPVISADGAVDSWSWPAEGVLAGRYGAAGGKGIDIVGTRNTPVRAVAPGKVVYSGSGLRGYGQLLIVKHSGEFLSAYAHNETILVKEGETVTAGQRIALMGDSDTDRVKLHFEIRRYGKPLDPMNYLPERS